MKRFALVFLLLSCMLMGWAQSFLVWDNPIIASNPTRGVINITKVELSNKETTLHVNVSIPAGLSFGFPKEIHLAVDGKDYPAVETKGIELDKELKMPESGNIDFSISFSALPKDVKQFDFTFSANASITGIRDRNAKRIGIDNTYWCDKKTGDWLIGFVGDHVIYDSKVWTSNDKIAKRDGYSFVATNGAEKLSIIVGKEKKNLRTIKINGKAYTCGLVTTATLPDYPVKDTRMALADNNYHMGDSVTIKGWYKDMPKDMWKKGKEFPVQVTNLFTNIDESYSAPMDSLGRFTLRMPLLNSCAVFCDWGRSYIQLYVEPGETYFLMKDYANDQTLIMGKDARLQNEILTNKLDLYSGKKSAHDVMKESGAMGYLAYQDSTKEILLKVLDDLYVKKPNISERFRTYYRNTLLTGIGEGLMQGRFTIRELPDEYVTYVQENILNKLDAPYTLTNNNFTILFRDYTGFYAEKVGQSKNVDGCYWLCEADKHGIVTLSAEDKQVVDTYKQKLDEFYKTLKTTPDSLQQSLINAFNTSDEVKEVNKLFNTDVKKYIIENRPVLEINNTISVLDSLGWDKRLRDIFVSQNVCRTINNTREPLAPSFLAFAEQNIEMPAAIDAVRKLNDKYVNLGKQTISDNILKSSDSVKEMSEGEQIFQKLTESYRGKYILVDVWGAWCSPCKMALSHSQEEYARLAPYDLVYMYFANQSTDKAWKNVIKEYNVTGNNVVHFNLPTAQQKAVEHYLNVSSYPSYRLINPEGKVLDVNADPRDLDIFEKMLKKIMNKTTD